MRGISKLFLQAKFQRAQAKKQRHLCSKAVVMEATQLLAQAAAAHPIDQLSAQLEVRTPEIEGRKERRVKRHPTAEEGTQD
jgi:phage portal protein BeeE